jgi:hypothetical protein
MKDSKTLLPDVSSYTYPGDEVMETLLARLGIQRTMLELRAITLGFLAGFRNKNITPDVFYTLIRGGQEVLHHEPELLGEYTRALIGLKNEIALWTFSTELAELKPAEGEKPIPFIEKRLAEAGLFIGLLLDGNPENISGYRETTQKSFPALVQVVEQLKTFKDTLESGAMKECPELLEILESYGEELWGIMIFLKNSEANEFIERRTPLVLPHACD